MNKLFTMIAKLSLGLAMAAGVGVAVSSKAKDVKPAEAASATWNKISADPVSGTAYVIVSSDGKQLFDGSQATIDSTSNHIAGTYGDSITGDYDGKSFTFTKSGSDWYIQSAAGTYIGRSSNSNGITTATTTGNSVKNTITRSNSAFTIKGTVARYLSYNASSGRFRYFGSGTVFLYQKSAKTLSSISLSGTYPTSFTTGDSFDHTGLVVTAHYSDSTTANVTSSATFSGYNMSTAGNQTVTVSYIEGGTTKTATYDITVSAPTTPTISLSAASLSGYTGQSFSVTATYANLTSDFAWSVSGAGTISGGVSGTTGDSRDGTSTYSGTLTGAGTKTLSASGGGADTQTYTITITKTTVSLNKASTSISVGKSETLTATTNVGSVTWESSNTAAASVTSAGVVSVPSNATVGATSTITATSTVDSSVYAECEVTVAEAPLEYQVTFGTAEGTTGISDFSNNTIVCPSEVTLDNITGNVYGSTTNAQVALRFGKGGTTGSFDASISGNYYIVSVTCNLKYYGTDTTATFAVTPNGGSAISKSLTDSWADYTYDVSAAQVKKVTLGTDTSGKRAFLSGFTIAYAAQSISAESITVTGADSLYVGETAISLTATPSNFSPASYTWSSTNTDAATVSGSTSTGTVTAVAKGTTVITASAEGTNGTVVSNEFTVTVYEFSISVSESAVTMAVNSSSTVTVSSEDASGSVIYSISSSDSDVATALLSGTTLTITSDSDCSVGDTATITITGKDKAGGEGYHQSVKTIAVTIANIHQFDFTNIDGFDDWSGSYEEHVVSYDGFGAVTFANANKNASTITDRPVTKGSDIEFVADGILITSATFVFEQWSTKDQTITLHYSTDGGETYTSTGISSSNFTITDGSLPANTNAIKVTFSSSSNQIGATSLTIGYAYPAVLSSVTTSGQTTSFLPGAGFAYGGTLTAHYTQGKADATVSPTKFKIGASGFNPESAGTEIAVGAELNISDHNGKYISVGYTEGGLTKWTALYQITVAYNPTTGVSLSQNVAEIGLNELFDYTEVDVTISPSGANPAYTWSVASNTVGDDYTFDGTGLLSGDTDGTITLKCASDADPTIFATLVVTVTGNPTAAFAKASTSGYPSNSETVSFTYGNMPDVSKLSIVSSNSSYASVGAVTTNNGNGSVVINFVAVGSANITISYDGGSTLSTLAVTVKADTVASVSWSASNIDVYSGAVLPITIEDTWEVNYEMASGSSDYITYSDGDYTVELGGSTITLPHTWVAADNGKTLCVNYNGVKSSTVSVSVTQSINSVMASEITNNECTLTSSTVASNTQSSATIGSSSWDISYDWASSAPTTTTGFDASKGKQFGTAKNSLESLEFSSSSFSGTITSVKVNTSGASSIDCALSVTVGSTTFKCGGENSVAISASATDYTFVGSASGTVTVTWTNSSAKAIYLNGFVVSTSSGAHDIANSADHKAAQRAAVAFANAFNAAMDETGNCTTGLDAAWATCSSAYTSFCTAAAALGETEEAYAKNLVKYATAQYSDDSGEACIERMMKTYEVMVQKHGKTAFMSDLVSLGAPQVSPLVNIIGENTNTVAIIVIISMVSVTAIGGYFFIRKRKEQ